MSRAGHAPFKCSAVISDVDGTLVTDDKEVTLRTQKAVAALRARGIAFSIISSRPPRGVEMLLEPLAITTPFAGFNGGVLVNADLSVIGEHLVAPAIARRTVALLDAHGVQAWVFSDRDWLLRDPNGPYVGKEQHTVGFRPVLVDEFGAALDTAGKIVGVSNDFERLAKCEQDLQDALAGHASVARSQPYYLDITHKLANKGVALAELAKRLRVPLAKIAVIGDGRNDTAMFARGGRSIAMGNASAQVREAADFVTDSNQHDGFAQAIERFVLGDGVAPAPPHLATAGDRA